jgi:hypothetical protein
VVPGQSDSVEYGAGEIGVRISADLPDPFDRGRGRAKLVRISSISFMHFPDWARGNRDIAEHRPDRGAPLADGAGC